MVGDIVIWLVLYIMIIIGFSLAFYVLLGSSLYSFRSWGASM